jgi:hypothetical protein
MVIFLGLFTHYILKFVFFFLIMLARLMMTTIHSIAAFALVDELDCMGLLFKVCLQHLELEVFFGYVPFTLPIYYFNPLCFFTKG